ncbi:hypothetical protein BSA16_33570 [Micromonospora sp. Rc5]|nr:hypothetical protein BSA16_33570 [Micromonospora sp. Rc5]
MLRCVRPAWSRLRTSRPSSSNSPGTTEHEGERFDSGGYNAAQIAEIVGPTGSVTTVEIDADIVDEGIKSPVVAARAVPCCPQ